MKDFMDMMKQAKELQGNMANIQAELEEMEIVGQSGAGAVRVTLNGKGALTGLKIDPGMFKPEDVEMLEDLIMAAHQEARLKMETAIATKMQEVAGGLSLPPGMKLI